MNFEYDIKKSRSNKEKHGLDFEEAQTLWDDERRLEAPVLRDGEKRFLVIGSVLGKYWTAIITYRENAVRIISVRRSRPEEVNYYEQKYNS